MASVSRRMRTASQEKWFNTCQLPVVVGMVKKRLSKCGRRAWYHTEGVEYLLVLVCTVNSDRSGVSALRLFRMPRT